MTAESPTPELAPCPFCGLQLIEALHLNIHLADGTYSPVLTHPIAGCILSGFAIYDKKAWNSSRPPVPPAPAPGQEGWSKALIKIECWRDAAAISADGAELDGRKTGAELAVSERRAYGRCLQLLRELSPAQSPAPGAVPEGEG